MRKFEKVNATVFKRIKRTAAKPRAATAKCAIQHASKKEVMTAYRKVSHKLEASSRYLADN